MIDRTITLELGKNVYDLVPTLDALRKINRRYDSMVDILVQVRKANFDAICFVIGAGANLRPNQTDQLERDLYETGMMSALPKVSEFLGVLMNPTGEPDEDGGTGKP